MALDATLNITSAWQAYYIFTTMLGEAEYFEPEITNILVVLTNFTGLLPVYTQSLLEDEDTTTIIHTLMLSLR
jgi:hypothetical protein